MSPKIVNCRNGAEKPQWFVVNFESSSHWVHSMVPPGIETIAVSLTIINTEGRVGDALVI